MSQNGEVQLNRKYMEMIKLLNIYLNHFPKHEKFALSNRIRNTAYEIYDCITEGQKRFIRKFSLYKFRRAVRQGNLRAVVSLLGHAKRTSSYSYMTGLMEAAYGKDHQISKAV